MLLMMLIDFKPELISELGIENDLEDMIGDSVACVELVWRGELQRRFFHVPDICHALAKSTKDKFIMTVKRKSPEDKLYGLLEGTKEIYQEVLWQESLKSWKIDRIFSRTMLDYTTWATFYLALAINLIFICYYTTRMIDCSEAGKYKNKYFFDDDEVDDAARPDPTCNEIYLNPTASRSTFILNLFLIAFAFLSVLIHAVVKIPVLHKANIDEVGEGYQAYLQTAQDLQLLHFILYFGGCVGGLFYEPCLSFLLLDFVYKSPIAQTVLNAAWKPRNQILATLLLTMIIMYIFAMFYFFFLNDLNPEGEGEGYNFSDLIMTGTLLRMWKFLLRWGVPFLAPVDYMIENLGWRMIADVLYFVAAALMINILKGITIDTFVEIRTEYEKRIWDTEEVCFICGIEKNTFNRTIDRDAFRVHVKNDQNLWNYIYFLIYIQEQDKDDDDGLESYVRKCFEEDDLTWFPMRKAMRLNAESRKGSSVGPRFKLTADLSGMNAHIQQGLTSCKDTLNRAMGRIEQTIEFNEEGQKSHSRAVTRAQSTRILTTREGNKRKGLSSAKSVDDFELVTVKVAYVAGLLVDEVQAGWLELLVDGDDCKKDSEYTSGSSNYIVNDTGEDEVIVQFPKSIVSVPISSLQTGLKIQLAYNQGKAGNNLDDRIFVGGACLSKSEISSKKLPITEDIAFQSLTFEMKKTKTVIVDSMVPLDCEDDDLYNDDKDLNTSLIGSSECYFHVEITKQ